MRHTCEVDDVGWVIHGLWPSNWDGSYPQQCGGSDARFDEAAIAPLEAQLDRYWPNSFADTPHTNFWKHEWSKHGTCAVAGSNLTTEREYFATTLELRKRYDVGAMLQAGGVTPSSTGYALSDVLAALQSALGVEPWVECNHEKGGVQQLFQVGLCMDKHTLQPLPCEKLSNSCVEGTPITYRPLPTTAVGAASTHALGSAPPVAGAQIQ